MGNCGQPCINTANCPSMCAQTIRTIENPTNAFTMECVATGACAQSQFTFTYTGGMTKYLESIKAGANYAMYGSTFTIDNTARGQGLTVRSIECGGLCAGATFRFLNSDYGDIKCEEYVGCGAYEQFLFFLICAGGMAKYLERIKARTNYRMFGSTFTIDNTARGQGLTNLTIDLDLLPLSTGSEVDVVDPEDRSIFEVDVQFQDFEVTEQPVPRKLSRFNRIRRRIKKFKHAILGTGYQFVDHVA